MDAPFPSWLTKQMLTGVKGFNLDAYLMALEGWRRGLTLKWYYDASDVTDLKMIGFNPLAKTFSLASEEATHYFYRSRGDKVANEAVDFVTHKGVAKKYLQEANVPTPDGKRYTEDVTDADIIADVASMGFPLVIKPTFGSLGKGVIVDIDSPEVLKSSLQRVRRELGYSDILVEQYVEGEDARIYVLDDRVLAATKRIPAHVIGDGEKTIEELIAAKNDVRQENPYLASKRIDIDTDLTYYLKDQGYTLQSIVPEGVTVYVRGQSNVASGGDPIDMTDNISKEAKDVAIQAVKAIPGLVHGGVDVLMNGDKISVIEINGTSDLCLHMFPTHGEPRHVSEGIIDYYFPDTVGKAKDRTQIYFNYKTIRQLFLNGNAKDLTVPDAPEGPLHAKRFLVSGKVQKVGYRNWIRKQAQNQGLHGYTRNLKNRKVVVIAASTDKDKVESFYDRCMQGPPRAKVEHVEVYDWDRQVRVGFEVRRK